MKTREIDAVIVQTVALVPGATVVFGNGGKHRFAAITVRGQTRKTFYSCSPSDWRALEKKRQDLRRLFRELGVEI